MNAHRFTKGQDSRELFSVTGQDGKVRHYRVSTVQMVHGHDGEILWVTAFRQTLKGTDYLSGEYFEFPLTDNAPYLADVIAYIKETVMCPTCSETLMDELTKGIYHDCETIVIPEVREGKHVDNMRAVDQVGTVIPLEALITHHGNQLINALNWNYNWRTYELLCERIANEPLAAVS